MKVQLQKSDMSVPTYQHRCVYTCGSVCCCEVDRENGTELTCITEHDGKIMSSSYTQSYGNSIDDRQGTTPKW